MKVLVTGANGFLGSRAAELLDEHGHDVVRLSRPGGAERAGADEARLVRLDAGDPAARDLVAGCDAVLHFAGIPDPTRARLDPARAVRENAGATLNLLEGCADHGAGLVYPSTLRAAFTPPPDAYATSKRLGEDVCQIHPARTLIGRFTSVYGPGQVAWEGATGAIASFAARALDGEPIVIAGDASRRRDFVYVDDALGAIESLIETGRWDETVLVASGRGTSLLEAAELVREAAGTDVDIQTPGGELPAGENESYETGPDAPLPLNVSLEEGIRRYVRWLQEHPASKSSARA
jgi:nucleoside-diphosphate-sugar epimerase